MSRSSRSGPFDPERPRVLRVDLGALGADPGSGVEASRWRASDPLDDRVGCWGGPAAALVWFQDRVHRQNSFALAVGPAVARGVPTAARAVVMAHAPLAGCLREGQVGSDLARRLARVTDLLLLEGVAPGAGAVLVLGEEGVRLECLPHLVGLDPEATQRALVEHLGPCASLRVGPAGEAGLPLANLAAGSDPASFVGRGGLGAAFAARGLKALALTAQEVPPVRDDPWTARQRASPRLAARAAGGSLELFESLAARSALGARGGALNVPLEEARAFGQEARERVERRHGCRGCPTPCGWVLDGKEDKGAAVGARFNALHPLGQNLGVERVEAARDLLACCNRLGLDAQEAGACLALWARDRPELWGDAVALEELLEQMVRGEQPGAQLGQGAQALGRNLGLSSAETRPRGQGLGSDSNLAVLLSARVGVRGREPMRTFPFLVGAGFGRERLEALVAPLPLPPGAEDPSLPVGKGRLVWWHENLVLALDLSGFCSFAAAGMLADGVMDLDELASVLEGDGEGSPGARWLGRGALLAELWRRLGEQDDAPIPEGVGGALMENGMWDEYQALRGVGLTAEDPLGERILERALAQLDGQAVSGDSGADAGAVEPTAPGRVHLRASGALAQILGESAVLELDLPVGVRSVLAQAALRWPAAAPLLEKEGAVLPGVHLAGRQLGPRDLVRDRDELDLVLVVSGG
jgi:aldehyde:ferredoxin oxidoreductase